MEGSLQIWVVEESKYITRKKLFRDQFLATKWNGC